MKNFAVMPNVVFVLLIGIVLMYAGIITSFFDTEGAATLIAGVIGFIGAILGGFITYFGVNRTLEHRDREIFFESATEKLMIMEGLIDTYKEYLNNIFLNELLSLDDVRDRNYILSLVVSLHGQLMKDRKDIYKVLELDAIEILKFHKKSLMSFSYKKSLTKEEAEKCKEKVRVVFQIFKVSKEQLESKYRNYKNGKYRITGRDIEKIIITIDGGEIIILITTYLNFCGIKNF